MNRSLSVLLILGIGGCNIPLYSVQTEYYGNRTIFERELDRLVADGMESGETIAVLEENGFQAELIAENDHEQFESLIIATKRTSFDTEDVRVSIPIKDAHSVRPFTIEWIDVETGKIVSTATTGPR